MKEVDEQSQARSWYDLSLCQKARSYVVWFRNESRETRVCQSNEQTNERTMTNLSQMSGTEQTNKHVMLAKTIVPLLPFGPAGRGTINRSFSPMKGGH